MSILGFIACHLIFLVSPFDDADAKHPIRHVRHEPAQPKPDAKVLVTARLPEGTASVTLKLQSVLPGKYIRKDDPAYAKEWVELPMLDDGKGGDVQAGDGIYSVTVPAKYQQHRVLVRYQIVATDRAGKVNISPEKDDTCPNYAWFCDAGPAAWTGSREPGKTRPKTYSSDFLKTMQSLHLLARAEDVEKSQWDDGNAHKRKCRARSFTVAKCSITCSSAIAVRRVPTSGKNKWGLKLNRGHGVELYDHNGILIPKPAAA
ncbi:MAG: choice-of-anchor X domain-containing protein [Gemmataceae bacterium]